MIRAKAPDGTVLQFPDGTDDDVVDRAMAEYIAEAQKPVDTAERPGPARKPQQEPSRYVTPYGPGGVSEGALGRVGTAAAEGWRQAPVFPTEAGPVLTGLNLPIQLGTAALRGGQQFVQEAATPLIGAQGGRDLAAIPEALIPPTLPYAGVPSIRNPLMQPPPPRTPAGVITEARPFVSERYNEPYPGGPPMPPPGPPGVPPGTPQPMLGRLNDLMQRDEELQKTRPTQIPPTSVVDPLTGEVSRVRNPRDPSRPQAEPPPPPPEAPAVTSTGSRRGAEIARGYYDFADRRGGVLSPAVNDSLIDDLTRSVGKQTEQGTAFASGDQVVNAVRRMEEQRGKPMTLRAVQEIDETMSDVIDAGWTMKGPSQRAREMMDVQTRFRNRIADATEAEVIGGREGFDALVQGRRAWQQTMKLRELERIEQRALRTDNAHTSFKTQIKALLDNAERIRGWSPEERAALKEAGERGFMGSIYHIVGSRLTPIVTSSTALPAAFMSGDLSTMALAGMTSGASYGASQLARNAAIRAAQSRMNNAAGVVAGGLPPPVNQLMPPAY